MGTGQKLVWTVAGHQNAQLPALVIRNSRSIEQTTGFQLLRPANFKFESFSYFFKKTSIYTYGWTHTHTLLAMEWVPFFSFHGLLMVPPPSLEGGCLKSCRWCDGNTLWFFCFLLLSVIYSSSPAQLCAYIRWREGRWRVSLTVISTLDWGGWRRDFSKGGRPCNDLLVDVLPHVDGRHWLTGFLVWCHLLYFGPAWEPAEEEKKKKSNPPEWRPQPSVESK